MHESGGSQICRRLAGPHIVYESLICLTEIRLLRVIGFDPGIRMFIEEYAQVRNMTETLNNGIEITGITHIKKANLSLLGVHGDTWNA